MYEHFFLLRYVFYVYSLVLLTFEVMDHRKLTYMKDYKEIRVHIYIYIVKIHTLIWCEKH